MRGMRKVVLGLGMSLDGYIARRDDSLDYLHVGSDYSMGPFFKTVDLGIMGRKTYDAALKMSKGKMNTFGMKCYVCSRTQPAGERGLLTFVNDPPKNLVEKLRKEPGKDIWLIGGGELAREFFKDDLVDELYLGIVPVLLGDGIPMFPSGFPERKFALIENKTYSQGLIALRYERARGNKGQRQAAKKPASSRKRKA